MLRTFLIATGAVAMLFAAVIGYIGWRRHAAQEDIHALCAETHPGDKLRSFLDRAGAADVHVEVREPFEEETGAAVASAGIFTDQWSCAVTHDGVQILEVELLEAD